MSDGVLTGVRASDDIAKTQLLDSMRYILTKHAQEQLADRNLSIDQVQSVLETPEQVVEERGMKVYQSQMEIDDKTQLLRVVVNDKTDPVIVLTAYPTTQIKRYWRQA